MVSTPCSECDEDIEIVGRVRLGQRIICNHCGAELEVVATEPLELELAQDEDDDLWDEDEIEEDDPALDDATDTEEADEDIDELDDEETDDLDDLEDDYDDFDDDDFDDFDDDFDDDDFDDELDDDELDDDRWS